MPSDDARPEDRPHSPEAPPAAAPPGDEARASTGQVAAIAGSVGLLIGFAVGLLVASTGSEGRRDPSSSRAPAAAPSASATPAPSAASGAGAVSADLLVDSFHLDLRDAGSRALLANGFYEAEGLDTPSPSIWSQGPSSTLRLPLGPGAGEYRLRLTARALESVAPLEVGVHLNGTDLGTVSIATVPGDVEVSVPHRALKTGTNELALSYPRTAKPSATIHGAKDDRDLAMDLFGLDLRPK